MVTEQSQRRSAAAPPIEVDGYIVDMLRQLAELAGSRERKQLAERILAAADAAEAGEA